VFVAERPRLSDPRPTLPETRLTAPELVLWISGMTPELIRALLEQSEATKEDDGWLNLGAYTLTLHTAFNGAALSFARIEGLKLAGPLVYARTARGETHVARIDDIFAGSVEASREKGRKAGFV
jgi:hypothetical protein